ncbi:hypothetical protein [Pelagibius sp.]|uniref:hypothetical protein n=1 Tax=Pelagibius sp. TaxID=1931238 RepID=UPI003BAF81E4
MKRDAKGRFLKGAGGRPRGARNRTTLAVEKLLDGEAKAVVSSLVKAAKDGDVQAGIAIMRAVCPAPKGRLLAIDLPNLRSADDAPVAIAAIVSAVASGILTASEGSELSGLIDRWRAAYETAALEGRIAALEAAAETGR